MTGLFSADYRIAANFRSQWAGVNAPFTTFSGAMDMKLLRSSLRNNIWGFGLMFFSDKAGDLDFSTNQFNFSTAFAKSLGGTQYLSIGLQAGFAQRGINYANMMTDEQFDGAQWDPTRPSGVNVATDNFSFVDYSAGFLWYMVPNNRTSMYAGVGAFHLNEPNQSFVGDPDVVLDMRMIGHGGAQFPLNQSMDLLPNFVYMLQGNYREFNIGSYLKFILSEGETNSTAFYLGSWYRLVGGETADVASDAYIFATRLDWMGLSLGLSYDVNLSGLQVVSSKKGGPEISLVYTGFLPYGSKSVKPKRKTFCPKW
jgi:type IX secretion system PorP/SprF family membrane protein